MITTDISDLIKEIHPTAQFIYEESDDDTEETFDERLRWHSPELTKPTYAELIAVRPQATVSAQMRRLREERDKRIAETDWWASSDRTMTAEQTAYRQALRDLPANTTDPANPVWPTKP